MEILSHNELSNIYISVNLS